MSLPEDSLIVILSTTSDNNMETIKKLLASLNLRESAQAVYLDILTHGESGARAIALRLGLPRSSVYDHLAPLLDLQLIGEKTKDGKTVFVIHDIAELDKQVAKQAESLSVLRARFAKEKINLANLATLSSEPKIKFVEGREAIANLMLEMLWDSAGMIETLWPYEEMLKVICEESLDTFNRKRIKQNISLRTIWTGPIPSRRDYLWRGGDFKVERRLAPKKCAPTMAYSIYGDSVIFFSGVAEAYAFVVKSQDFAFLMRMQFKVLWEVSKESK